MGSERGECRNEDPCGEISPESLCLTRNFDVPDEGVRCTPIRGDQLSLPCSDSLGLSLFDESRGSKERESSPWRIFCDPRLLEEETQVSDFGVSAATQQDSHLLSPIQSAPQAFGFDNATEEIELLALWKEVSDIGIYGYLICSLATKLWHYVQHLFNLLLRIH